MRRETRRRSHYDDTHLRSNRRSHFGHWRVPSLCRYRSAHIQHRSESNRARDHKGETTRSTSDPYADELYYRDSDFQIVERVVELANKRGVKPTQIALAWMLTKPEVSAPIIGASKPHHLPEAVGAIDIKLSADEIKYLEELYQPHPVLGHS